MTFIIDCIRLAQICLRSISTPKVDFSTRLRLPSLLSYFFVSTPPRIDGIVDRRRLRPSSRRLASSPFFFFFAFCRLPSPFFASVSTVIGCTLLLQLRSALHSHLRHPIAVFSLPSMLAALRLASWSTRRVRVKSRSSSQLTQQQRASSLCCDAVEFRLPGPQCLGSNSRAAVESVLSAKSIPSTHIRLFRLYNELTH